MHITSGNPAACEIKGGGSIPRYASIRGGYSKCHFLTADKPDPIRGYGFTGIVIDDAPFIKKTTWEYVIRPTLAQTMGWAALVGTPKGRNWFHEEDQKSKTQADHESFHFPSNENPYFPQSEWELLQNEMPADVFRQEYMAEFLEDSAGVFKGLTHCLNITGEFCKCGGHKIIGVDLAKHVDYTVLIAICPRCGCCSAFERFNRIDWPLQKARIADFAKKNKGRIIIDATGVGDPIYDDLRGAGIIIDPFKFTEQSKRQIVQGLMVAIEQRMVSWPAEWNILTEELERYEYQIGPTGKMSYNAPDGFHDDCVMALALAVSGIHGYIRPRLSIADSGESLRQDIDQLDEEIKNNPNLTEEEKRELLKRD